MPDLRLLGCRPRPLIGYLKALGVLRVVSLQADRPVRGRWSDGVFELRTDLDNDELTEFLLDRYSPSPVVSPWNGGSGFHPKDRKEAISALEHATEPRFAAYREAVRAARDALNRLQITDKPQPDAKLPLIRELRRRIPDEALPWLDAAIVVTGDKVSYPPLLGSGGNDGRYDFSNNYAQAVVQCLIAGTREDSLSLLSASLLGGAADLQRKLSLGHLSRDSSPTNSPYGEADSLGNPWDLTLAVEGTLLLVAGAARRHGTGIGGALVAPFTVYPTAAGYGSAVGGESGRAELWLPLWSGWATCPEIAMLARESRAQVGHGSSRRQARSGLDFARAAGALGVARGIDAFERYSILERAGQSSLAVPAGRVAVTERSAGANAIQSIDAWLSDVVRFGREDSCPRNIQIAVRRLEHAGFAVASRGTPADACSMLEAMGEVEHALARSGAAVESQRVRPLHGASALAWIDAANDGTAEFAVAASVASLRDRKPRSPTLRDYLHGTNDGGSRFDPERRHVIHANSPVRMLAAVHARRHLDAARSHAETEGNDKTSTSDRRAATDDAVTSQLEFDDAVWCNAHVARLLAADRLDDDRIIRLVYGLALLDYREPVRVETKPADAEVVTPPFDVLALAWMGHRRQTLQHKEREMLRPRPGGAACLAAGAVKPVVANAALRLRMAGQPPIYTTRDLMTGPSTGTQLGPRLCAALMLKIHPSDLEQTARRITIPNPSDEESQQRKEAA